MIVAELAQKLNIPVSEIFKQYKKIEDLPENENFILTTKQIENIIQIFTAKENPEKINLQIESKNIPASTWDLFNINLDKIKSRELNNLETIFKKSDSKLIKEFKKYNEIPDLILLGDFKKIEGHNFGFFKNITHQNGTVLTYPISNDFVDEVFIQNGELTNGKRYLFEAKIASLKERVKKTNPFLLQARSENIQEVIEFNAISEKLKLKQEELEQINSYLEKAEERYKEKKVEIEERVLKVLKEKQNEANEIIENYQETINQKFNEIQNKENNLSSLKEKVEETNNYLQKMENLLSTLKERISLCRSLQFISEDDENKYLNLLSAKEFKLENHHDFEKDFEKNFSKLSEHIHAYLYHKKSLIYTQYQIKNFLTLLRTHDIIVLSGLSGSGKTQIVKAFAEALGGIAKIIPVKPNWTSSDDLIGYYNPLQMSFLPTPFTEAIVEAINNPNQLYFICLDEMNLARAEYYFADFLSKLEERSKQPEIELYANHEEELFVSEFSTLLNLIESSINGEKIKSWQEFLDNEEARKKFFEMLGNTDKESMLNLHAKMKRRLIDILKFPSTIRIPNNVLFIGAINIYETTHYFSPKILDRIHVVKFENPLLIEEKVNSWFVNTNIEKELIPVYVRPNLFSQKEEFPKVNNIELSTITEKLKEINHKFLLPLNIDFGIRSIRQSLNYAELNKSTYDYGNVFDISLNTVILQKIFPRFIFDGSEIAKNGETKMKVVEELRKFLSDEFHEFYYKYESNETEIGKSSSEYLEEMIEQANRNNSQFNFFA